MEKWFRIEVVYHLAQALRHLAQALLVLRA